MINIMKRRGFTLIELMVVIVVMGALLILNVVNLRETQASARDTERTTDIETLASHLESFYTAGTDTSSTVGRYPSTSLIASGQLPIKVLVVAGGGGGGSSTSNESGGGGGAGAVLYNASKNISIQSYQVTVGDGGAGGSNGGSGLQGGTSTFSDINANGGGSGGKTNSNGKDGGSGGGGAGAQDGSTNDRGYSTNNSLTTGGADFHGNYGGLGQWRANGKSGGGGGGAGGIGGSGYDGATEPGGPGKMNGGVGWATDISGVSTLYGGGGGGASIAYWGAGGTGGGGNGTQNGQGAPATAYTGGGGGGGGTAGGGNGGSGIVIISYPGTSMTATGGTITYTDATNQNPRSTTPYTGGNTVHTFTSSGTFTVTSLMTNTIQQMLRDIDTASLTAPGQTDWTQTFISAYDTSPSGQAQPTGNNINPVPSINQYIYQPLKSDGSLCTLESQDCRKFNLYYKVEKLDTATNNCPDISTKICMVTSKNQ